MSSIASNPAGAAPPAEKHIPGETGIWVFILGDMFVFTLFFAVYTFYFRTSTTLYHASQATLNIHYGLANTLLLLTSSYLVVLAVNGFRRGLGRGVAGLFALAFLCGLGFVAIKILEYREKISAGLSPMTNDFYMFYFVLTGIHFAHVLIGMVLLGVLFRAAMRAPARPGDLTLIEIGASYWHMVDILWIVLFGLLFVLK